MQFLVVGLLAVSVLAQAVDAPLDPAQAIARSDDQPHRTSRLTYALLIVSTERTLSGVFLHSTDDYRRADDLTLRLTFPVAHRLAKQLGGAPETVLKGRKLIVRGIVERHPIANTFGGQPRSVNRIQHEIVVSDPGQIISIG